MDTKPPIEDLRRDAILRRGNAQLAALREQLADALSNPRLINARVVDAILQDMRDVYGVMLVAAQLSGWLSPWYPSLIPVPPGNTQERPDAVPKDLAIDLTNWDFLNSAAEWIDRQISGFPGRFLNILDQSQVQSAALGVDVDNAMLDTLNNELRDSLRLGEGRDEWRERLKGIMDTRRGFDETIARTAHHRAMNQGKEAVLAEPVIRDLFPYRKYLATMDNRARESHKAMDGKIYHKDSPLARHARELQDEYNCVLPEQEVQGQFIAGAKSLYDGKAIEIITRSGSKIRVTENHPILTEHGFIRAGAIQEGDKLIRHVGHREEGSHRLPSLDPSVWSPQEHYAPSTIEKVFGALAAAGGKKVRPGKASDFHGDGQFIKGDIDVVGADFRLLGDRESVEPNGVGNVIFKHPDFSGVCGTDLSSSVAVVHSRPFQPLRIGLTADLDTSLNNPTCDDCSGYKVTLRQLVDRESASVLADDGSAINGDSRLANLHAEPAHPGTNPLRVASKAVRNIIHTKSGLVRFDEVAALRPIEFRGHVYDLQSLTGFIVADGILIANCRCSSVPMTEDDALAEGVSEGGEDPTRSGAAAVLVPVLF